LQALFITGTDTDVGKTIVSAWLTLHWQAAYWKPIQSGLAQGSDSETVTRLGQAYCYPERWKLNAALSPHQAAALENRTIDMTGIQLPTTHINHTHTPIKRLIVEGAGGLLTPLNQSACIADLIIQLKLPVLLVARSRLGTINHTCLTIEALRTRHLNLLGVIMVGEQNIANRTAIEHYGNTRVLAELPLLPEISQSQLQQHLLPEALKQALANVPNCPI
jgi:dethiobiotin synthetase/malonyl-CoA O-methyltransferase